MSDPKFYADAGAMPEDTRKLYARIQSVNADLFKIIKKHPVDVGVNAIVNILIGQAVHGSKEDRDTIAAVMEHSLEYVRRLDMLAPAGTAVN